MYWKRMLVLLMGLLWGGILQAQTLPPLSAPFFALNTPEQDKIIFYNVALNHIREIVLGAGEQRIWGFSPEGCRLLATLNGRLVSANLQGEDVRSLVQVPDSTLNWEAFEPAWSPDGERIVFTLIENPQSEERRSYIVWIPSEGGTPTRYSQSGREYNPQWSPDSQYVAYVSYEQRVAGTDMFSTAVPTQPPSAGTTPEPPVLLNEADLWIASTDGEQRYRLTNFPTGNVSMPRWSPDGTLVGFVYSPVGNNDMFWMIANQEDAIPTQLSFDYVTVLDLTWQLDSTAMIGSAMGMQGEPQNRLWRIPLVGRADTDATRYLPLNELVNADYPRFSADGNYLAARTQYAIALVDLQTTQQVLLQESWALGNTPVIWSSAGFNGEATCSSS
jgi:Tol biopolymer transport system component